MRFSQFYLIAIYVVLGLLLLLNRCDRPRAIREDAEAITDTVAEASPAPADSVDDHGHTGNLRVTLIWNFEADIDVHVLTPKDTEIYFQHKRDRATGGEQDRDNTEGGPDSHENVYWTDPPRGLYKIYVNYYDKAANPPQDGEVTIEVTYNGEKKTYKRHMSYANKRIKYPIAEVMVE